MKLICAQYTTVRKSMFNACGACGFGLFIPHYKVPDLTGDVEFGGEDPAFADNVIVVEGCFLRISIEGLKVWPSWTRGGALCSWRTRCRESCPVTKGSAFSGYWYPTLTIDDQRQYHRHFVNRATTQPPATEDFKDSQYPSSPSAPPLLTTRNLEPTIAQGRSFVYFFSHLLSFLRHIFCVDLLIMMIMSFVFLRYTQRPLWSTSINTTSLYNCTQANDCLLSCSFPFVSLSGIRPIKDIISTIRQTQKHSQTQSHE